MMLKWSHATDITNMGQINYYFFQCIEQIIGVYPLMKSRMIATFEFKFLVAESASDPE